MGHALTLSGQSRTEDDEFEFASIETAIRELKGGRMVVVVDDEDRENEGDLTMAAEMITPEAINFMAIPLRATPRFALVVAAVQLAAAQQAALRPGLLSQIRIDLFLQLE